MNPFDLKTALLAKHTQHAVMVHFPIALLLVSFIFDLLARWRKISGLAAAARYNLFVAAGVFPLVVFLACLFIALSGHLGGFLSGVNVPGN
jgi:uncharacterized membrane protein